jgi:hypothetical protein
MINTEILNSILYSLVNNFDFMYMIMINIITYVIIKLIDEYNGDKEIKVIYKRIVLVATIIVVTVAYKLIGYDNNIVLVNSAILSPVFYSWIIRPILIKFNIGYKQFDKYLK